MCARLVIVLSVGLGLVLSAQGRPDRDEVAARLREHGLRAGEALADRTKAVMGRMNLVEARAVRRWDVAVQAWKKEKHTSAGALLSEGVLFDCLSRLHGILTVRVASEVLTTPYFLDLAGRRPSRASKAFQTALKVDPHLIEARFRDARIRAARDQRARTQLEQLSEETGVIAYLAAMSRAETARDLEDASGARRWYQRAAVLFPNAPAPRVGLAAFAGDAVPFESLDRTDPYYTYPCVVLTQPVRAELSRRMNK